MGREWLLLSVGMRSSEQQHRNSLEAVHLPERKTHRVQKSMKIKKASREDRTLDLPLTKRVLYQLSY